MTSARNTHSVMNVNKNVGRSKDELCNKVWGAQGSDNRSDPV